MHTLRGVIISIIKQHLNNIIQYYQIEQVTKNLPRRHEKKIFSVRNLS